MERFTKKELFAGHEVNCVSGDGCFDMWVVPKRFMGAAIDRLAAYEDTGLEPEIITEIQRILEPMSYTRYLEIMRAERDGRDGRLVVLHTKTATDQKSWSDHIRRRFEKVE